MDDFIKNIKKKLSVENIVEFMKEAKIIDEQENDKMNEDTVRDTLSKITTNNIIEPSIMSAKIVESLESANSALEQEKNVSDTKIVDTKTNIESNEPKESSKDTSEEREQDEDPDIMEHIWNPDANLLNPN